MNLNEFLKYKTNSNNNNENTTHLINISAAISRFPGLMSKVISSFSNDDDDILEEYEKIKIDDNELRETLICSIIFGEKYEKEKFKKIIEDYVTAPKFNSIIYQNVNQSGDSEGYALACALLDDYYNYLDDGIWKGLSTRF